MALRQQVWQARYIWYGLRSSQTYLVMFTLEQPDSERAIVDQFLNSAQDDRFQR